MIRSLCKIIRLSLAVVASWLVCLLSAQAPSAAHHSYLWDHEFSQIPNLYIPQDAIVDSRGVLWVLCSARMGNQSYRKQHVTEALFLIDADGRQLSTAELDLPLSAEERRETSDYRLAPLPNGHVALVFNKIRFEGRGESYLGAFYIKLGADGAPDAPLQAVARAGPEYSELLSLRGGDLLLGGSQGTLISFDPNGKVKWRKSFLKPPLVNFDSANLSEGNICLSAWQLGNKGVLNKLQLMQVNQQGIGLHSAEVGALRGQVAGGPEGSCVLLYDRAPTVNKGEYLLTAFDRSFTRQWTAPVSQTSMSGAEFDLVTVPGGYLVQIGNVLVEYGWSGQELWTETEVDGAVSTLVAASTGGVFVITKDLHMNNGFRVKHAKTTHEPETPER